ncbi:MAG: glycosyltransferase family 2 protein [Chloroflexi bacterium]|nr:glycosyltransferase family 2 protein [Chloroflexota bacterium]
MSFPTVTTVLPTYRRPEMLRRAIESALAQTYPHLRVCVYDNASGDGTREVVTELAERDSRVTYHCHPENIGSALNFQYGVTHVETECFSVLSDDDVLLPGCYEAAVAELEKSPEAAFAANKVLLRDDQGRVLPALPRWDPGYYRPPEGLLRMVTHGQPVWTGAVFRTAVFETVGHLDLDIPLGLDSEFLFRVAKRMPYVLTPAPGAIFTAHSLATDRGIIDFDLIWPASFRMISKITEDESLPGSVRREFAQRLGAIFKRALFANGVKYLYRGRFEEADKTSLMLRQRFPRSGEALTMPLLSRICQRWPFVLETLRLAFATRSRLRQAGTQDLREEFSVAGQASA